MCILVEGSSIHSSDCSRKTTNSLSPLSLPAKMILEKIVKNLDVGKAHGHDMINICMLKLCGQLISKTLKFIFRSFIAIEKFPSD